MPTVPIKTRGGIDFYDAILLKLDELMQRGMETVAASITAESAKKVRQQAMSYDRAVPIVTWMKNNNFQLVTINGRHKVPSLSRAGSQIWTATPEECYCEGGKGFCVHRAVATAIEACEADGSLEVEHEWNDQIDSDGVIDDFDPSSTGDDDDGDGNRAFEDIPF